MKRGVNNNDAAIEGFAVGASDLLTMEWHEERRKQK
jgi:hypothetical protein